MSHIRLYHRIKPTFMLDQEPKRSEYSLVAAVEVPELETPELMLENAYGRTQNIDSNWTKTDKSIDRGRLTDEARSTSIGDVMMIKGDLYCVDMEGFMKIENKNVLLDWK